ALPRGLDHAAGQARAGVAGRLAHVVVGIGVHNHAAADDVGGRAVVEGDALEARVHPRDALVVGDDVVGVATVVRAMADAAGVAGAGVEMPAGAAGVGRAAVAVLVQVEAVLAAGLESRTLAGRADHAVHHLEHQRAGHLAALGRRQGRGGA